MDSMYSVSAQGAGAMVGHFNQMRMDEFIRKINYQDINLDHAMNEINEARKFIKKPSEILGCDRTKFGEVAEHLEVAFKNADELIVGNPAPATFNGVGRTAPEDFLVNGMPVQSKFVQYHKSMDAIMTHITRYPDFLKNNGSYIIPKDHYEQIIDWLKMSPEDLSKIPNADGGRTARAVVEQIRKFEEQTDVKFEDAVKRNQATQCL